MGRFISKMIIKHAVEKVESNVMCKCNWIYGNNGGLRR